MIYVLTFIEGIITFISPCFLPMLPIYISYFMGDNKSGIKNALGFVLGFTIVFVSLGAFAGTIGRFLLDYTNIVNIVSGSIVIIFGLSYLDIIKIKYLNIKNKLNVNSLNFVKSMIFGIIFSISWTPCVGAFLASALTKASISGSTMDGIIMLLLYSLGLGIPFILSTIFIERLTNTFNSIKKHYNIITKISGCFLILTGLMMMTGYMNMILSFLSFK